MLEEQMTKETLAQFIIDWGIPFAPDDCVDNNLEEKEYSIALEFAGDILSYLKEDER